MNAATAGIPPIIRLTATTIKKARRTITGHTPVALTAAYNAATNSVMLTIQGKQAFAKGGEITVIYSPPDGVSSAEWCPTGIERRRVSHLAEGDRNHNGLILGSVKE